MTYPTIEISNDGEIVRAFPTGPWSMAQHSALQKLPSPGVFPSQSRVVIDGSRLEQLDTAGALALFDHLGSGTLPVTLEGFSASHRAIAELVLKNLTAIDHVPEPHRLNLIQTIGSSTLDFLEAAHLILNFLGRTVTEMGRLIFSPRLFRYREFFVQLESACVAAVPIIALVTMLIGVVVAYLFASQSQKYGANIFIVESIGLAMCRELSPLIVAVVVAGRSGSAFTAQIGTMKLNEEIDALQTLGLSPMQVLVLPRVLALMVAMPILVFVGDAVGILGGSIIANLQLDITPVTFLERLQYKIPVRSYLVGLVKAPVFALFIAIIGCRMGLTVENNARSVGLGTTSTVVQSIVSVILLNALFAVIFVELKI